MKFQISGPKVSQKSFTLVDVLVGTFLILIVFLGIFELFQLGFKVVTLSQNKIVATAIVNGEIEKIRNLSYESVGVEGSFPNGVLEPNFKVTQNKIEYTIENRVDYVVDATDGIAPPDDDCPNDYKRAEVKVSWSGRFPGEVKISTDIAPKNLAQECTETGGILSVSAFDAFGIMVPSPLIEVKDPETNQTIKTATPVEGKHFFSLSPSTYKVIVSKTNYSTEQTYGSGEIYQGKTIANPDPERSHPIVLEGQITEKSFSIDRLSSMSIQVRGTKGAGYPVVHNISFILTGAKKIGTDSDENPIYKYSQNHTTNGPGTIDIPNLECDSYNFLLATPDLDLLGIESPPGIETTQPLGLAPNTNLEARLIVKAENTLLITAQDINTGEPIFSATARLHNTDLGYDATQYTDEEGQTYFIPLEPALYDLEVQAPGYSSTSTTVDVSGETTQIITLEQIE